MAIIIDRKEISGEPFTCRASYPGGELVPIHGIGKVDLILVSDMNVSLSGSGLSGRGLDGISPVYIIGAVDRASFKDPLNKELGNRHDLTGREAYVLLMPPYHSAFLSPQLSKSLKVEAYKTIFRGIENLGQLLTLKGELSSMGMSH